MTITDGWHSFAVRVPGPPNRRQRWNNDLSMIVHHSMEGTIPGPGGYDVMRDPNREGTAWHGTVGRDGILRQHYPVEAGLWHGGPNANPYGPGYELEGFAGEPINDAQLDTFVRIHHEIAEYTGREYTRDNGGLKEHGELASTACPSNRYDRLWANPNGVADLTPDQVRDIINEMKSDGALASTTDVLSCIAQIVGVDESTYSEKAAQEKIKAIRAIIIPPKPTRVTNVSKD